jgi:hypothetical protein
MTDAPRFNGGVMIISKRMWVAKKLVVVDYDFLFPHLSDDPDLDPKYIIDVGFEQSLDICLSAEGTTNWPKEPVGLSIGRSGAVVICSWDNIRLIDREKFVDEACKARTHRCYWFLVDKEAFYDVEVCLMRSEVEKYQPRSSSFFCYNCGKVVTNAGC